jgi:hypothetical protein
MKSASVLMPPRSRAAANASIMRAIIERSFDIREVRALDPNLPLSEVKARPPR